FLKEARARIARFQRSQRAPAFVASDFAAVYAALRRLEESGPPPGRLFCEWGSGFGVASCLAAMLGFDARGIEADGRLVAAARRLAAAFDSPAAFVRGNFPQERAKGAVGSARPRGLPAFDLPRRGRLASASHGGGVAYPLPVSRFGPPL